MASKINDCLKSQTYVLKFESLDTTICNLVNVETNDTWTMDLSDITDMLLCKTYASKSIDVYVLGNHIAIAAVYEVLVNNDYDVTKKSHNGSIKNLSIAKNPSTKKVNYLNFKSFYVYTGLKSESEYCTLYNLTSTNPLYQAAEIIKIKKANKDSSSVFVNENKKLMNASFENKSEQELYLPKAVFYLQDEELEHYHEFMSSAYIGGLCTYTKSLHNKVLTNVTSYDINSSYPYILANENLPVGQAIRFSGNPDEMDDSVYYISNLIVKGAKVKPNKFACLTGRYVKWFKHSDSIDEVEFYMSDYYVIENEPNKVLSIYADKDYLDLLLDSYTFESIEYVDGYYFQTKSGLFADYINDLYEKKSNANGVERNVYKLQLNSLYGMFGLKCNEEESYHKEYYMPIAIAVASKARCRLINAINANLSRFIYCDTDSIYLIGNEKPNGINLSNKLGDWKLEHVCDKFLVLGNKTYGLHDVNTNEDVFKIAGLNKDDIADITWNDFKFGNKVTCHQLEASSNGLTMVEKEFTLGYKQIDEIPESFVVDMIEQLLEIDDEYRAYASYKEYYEQNKLLKGEC